MQISLDLIKSKRLVRDTTIAENFKRDTSIIRKPRGGYEVLPPGGTRLVSMRGVTVLLAKYVWPQNKDYYGRTPKPNRIPEEFAPARRAGNRPTPEQRIAQWRAQGSDIGARIVADRRRRAKEQRQEMRNAAALARGATRGSLVHAHLSAFTQLDARSFRNEHGPWVHPMATLVSDACLARKWIPYWCDYAVKDVEGRWATEIDATCLDKYGRIVYIELKTGYKDGQFHAVPLNPHDARFVHAVPPLLQWGHDLGLKNTAHDRAVLQHLLGVTLAAQFNRQVPGTYRAYIVRVDDTAVPLGPEQRGNGGGSVEFYPLKQSLLAKGPAVLEAFRQIVAEGDAREAAAREAQKRQRALERERRGGGGGGGTRGRRADDMSESLDSSY